jgi:hypothetical protein
MSYAQQPAMHAPNRGRDSQAYRRASDVVRQRAKDGEICWFYGKRPECPGKVWWWGIHPNDKRAFSTHHLIRLMDGGDVLPDPALMVPAHRGCNAWDGLKAQNDRRKGQPPPRMVTQGHTERTSRTW